ncbi:MAG: ArsA family ATPase [Microcystaceae cyanobacterium]
MTLILTFLGKGGTGRTTTAIAVAKKLSRLGCRVLLTAQDPSLGWELGLPLEANPTEIEPRLYGQQFFSTALLEKGWEKVKELESQYLRSPTLKSIYGQELGILPGMDEILRLNALREKAQSRQYDVIVYDGSGDVGALRMLGVPEVADWYWRRFRQVLQDSDVVKTLLPFLQPIAGAIFSASLNFDNLADSPQSPEKFLAEGRAFLSDPQRFAAYLVTTSQLQSVMMAKHLWGGAQQIGLTVKGVLQSPLDPTLTTLDTATFAPLAVTSLPQRIGQDWESLINALPDVRELLPVPHPLSVEIAQRQVKVFLPGFDKKHVKLTQYGPEITIEAGDQRRNIALPPPLSGQPVTGAKFKDGYLIISF